MASRSIDGQLRRGCWLASRPVACASTVASAFRRKIFFPLKPEATSRPSQLTNARQRRWRNRLADFTRLERLHGRRQLEGRARTHVDVLRHRPVAVEMKRDGMAP